MNNLWNVIPIRTPADRIFGKTGANRWIVTREKIIVECVDRFNNKTSIVEIPSAFLPGFERWLNGEYIQNALPMVSASVREQLISGMSDEDFPSEDTQ